MAIFMPKGNNCGRNGACARIASNCFQSPNGGVGVDFGFSKCFDIRIVDNFFTVCEDFEIFEKPLELGFIKVIAEFLHPLL